MCRAAIAVAHDEFLGRHPDATRDGGHDVYLCLLMLSMGAGRPENVPEDLWDAVRRHCVSEAEE